MAEDDHEVAQAKANLGVAARRGGDVAGARLALAEALFKRDMNRAIRAGVDVASLCCAAA